MLQAVSACRHFARGKENRFLPSVGMTSFVVGKRPSHPTTILQHGDTSARDTKRKASRMGRLFYKETLLTG
jgi:hypothetical protein